jgi:CBS domain-containing protein
VVEHDKVVGMLSDRDLLLSVGFLLTCDREVDHRTHVVSGPTLVRDVMSRPVVTISALATIAEAARVFVQHEIGAVPVLSGTRLIGMLSRTDLLRQARLLAKGDVFFHRLDDPIASHMRARVTAVHVSDSIQTVVAAMRDKHLRHMPVVGDEFVVGIVSDRDIRRACGREHIEDEMAENRGEVYIGAAAVGEIMSTNLVTARPYESLTDAAGKLCQHRISALPVIDEKRLVGIITDTDIVRLMSKQDV